MTGEKRGYFQRRLFHIQRDRIGAGDQIVVPEVAGDRRRQPRRRSDERRHHRPRDGGGDEKLVALHRLEDLQHSQHRAEKSQQRQDKSEGAQQIDPPFQLGQFVERRIVHRLPNVGVAALVGEDRRDEQPRRRPGRAVAERKRFDEPVAFSLYPKLSAKMKNPRKGGFYFV